MKHRINGVCRRVGVLAATGMGVLAVGLVMTASSQAAVLPTSTSLTASQQVVSGLESTTLTATVNYGLLVTPAGTVTFTDETNGRQLGTATLPSLCLVIVKACSASITIQADLLDPNENTVEASYGGDTLSDPSSGTELLFRGQETDCDTASGCDTGDIYSPDDTADVQITEEVSSQPESIDVAFGTTPLGCDTPGTGDTIAWTSTNDPSDGKYIYYSADGPAAVAAQDAHPITSDGGGYVCFDSASSFTTSSGSAATKESDGTYEGVLAQCTFTIVGEDEVPNNEPCVLSSYYGVNSGGPDDGEPYYETQIAAPAGDPRAGH